MSYTHPHHLLIHWLMYLWLVYSQTTALWGAHSHLLQPWHTLVSTVKPALQKGSVYNLVKASALYAYVKSRPDTPFGKAAFKVCSPCCLVHVPAHFFAVTVNPQRLQGQEDPSSLFLLFSLFLRRFFSYSELSWRPCLGIRSIAKPRSITLKLD